MNYCGGLMTEKSLQWTIKLILLTIKYLTELRNLALVVSICLHWIFSLSSRNTSRFTPALHWWWLEVQPCSGRIADTSQP